MKSVISRMGIALAASVFAVSVAAASPGKTKAPKCKACGMELSAKKDKMHTTAVKMGKTTYYCCAKCPMGKKK